MNKQIEESNYNVSREIDSLFEEIEEFCLGICKTKHILLQFAKLETKLLYQ